MKLISLLAAVVAVNGHTIFQRVKVNGADQGYLTALRAPSVNNPVQNVQDAAIACNTGIHTPVSSTVISISAGATVGSFWQHILGGPQGTNDADNPIASSHKGPLIVYLAPVSNATSASATGLKWFKVAQDGFDTSSKTWGVDRMISGGGWWSFTMPSCIAPGQYLMKVELIALHSAYSSGGAQFYLSCAQIQVTGSGTFTPPSSSILSFPGSYTASDPGILINIYGPTGLPDNGGKTYVPPGGSVMSCANSGGGSGSGTQPVPTATGTTAAPTGTTPSGSGSGATAALYGQCGGQGWTGPTVCAQGTCKATNQFYSQCVP